MVSVIAAGSQSSRASGVVELTNNHPFPLRMPVRDQFPQGIAGSSGFVARVPGDASRGDWLIVSGATPDDVERAAMNLTVRYWKFAKDAAARRIGLVAKELPQGGDPALLP